MGVSLQGPIAGAVIALIGLYLLFGPIEALSSKPSPIQREYRRKREIPTWMKVFFRGLGLLLLVLGSLLLAPLVRGA